MSDITTLRDMLFARAKEFVTTDSDALEIIDTFLSDSIQDISSEYFGTKTDRAIVLLTAHNLTVLNPLTLAEDVLKNQVGNKTATIREIDKVKKEDRWASGSSANNESMASEYSTSIYGLQFFALKKSCNTISAFIV